MRLKRIVTVLVVAAVVPVVANGAPDAQFDEASANCVVEPNMTVEISSRVDGILAEVRVERGDPVAEGTVLALLEDGVERAELVRARARATMNAEIRTNAASVEYGEKTLDRVSKLSTRKVIAPDEVDRVESETKVARHRLQQARENKRLAEIEVIRAKEVLKRHTIVSPVNGVIAERYLNPGESTEEKPILRIAQIHPLRVELVLPGSEYGRITPGDHALVRLEDPNHSEHTARVVIVDPLIDAASGTFRVTLELPNPEYRLTSGLRCNVAFLDGAGTLVGQQD